MSRIHALHDHTCKYLISVMIFVPSLLNVMGRSPSSFSHQQDALTYSSDNVKLCVLIDRFERVDVTCSVRFLQSTILLCHEFDPRLVLFPVLRSES